MKLSHPLLATLALLLAAPLPATAAQPPSPLEDSPELKIALVGKATELPAILRTHHTLSPNSRQKHTHLTDTFIASLDETEFESVLTSLPSLRYNFDTYYPCLSVARRYGAKDPRAALDYFHRNWEPLNQQFDAYRIIADLWHAKAPAEFETYTLEALRDWSPDTQRMASYLADLLVEKHLAASTLEATTAWMDTIPHHRARAALAFSVLYKLPEAHQLEDLAPWIARHSIHSEFKTTVIETATALTSVSPLRGYNWTASLPPSPAKYYAVRAQFEILGAENPMIGVGWFNSSLEEKDQGLTQLLGLPTTSIAKNQSPAWLESYILEDMIAAYVTGLLRRSDAAKTFFIVSQITDPVFQPKVQTEYIRQLRRRDYETALAEARSLGIPLK